MGMAELFTALDRAGWTERLRRNALMAPYTSYCIGGPADLLLEAVSVDEIVRAVGLARSSGVPVTVLGGASNVLVADEGIRGLVILNRAVGFERLAGEERVSVQSGTSLRKLARWAIAQGLAGLEWAIGVPGSLGGALVGNAGAYGGSMSEIVERVQVLTSGGDAAWWSVADMAYRYRSSRIKMIADRAERPIVLRAELQLSASDPEVLSRIAAGYNEQRRQRTPSGQCAGSVFKRTLQFPAGFLIDQAGLKGMRLGGAQVSEQHANFIMNCGSASASDVQGLIEQVQATIWEQYAQRLEPEIELIGAWPMDKDREGAAQEEYHG